MLTTTYQRAYPKYSIATVILFILLVGVPGLLTALNPGGNEVAAGMAEATMAETNNITLTLPDGWERTDTAGAVALSKGAATIEIRTVPWAGTPAELYEDNRKKLAEVLEITSIEEPSPTDSVAEMTAVTGQISMVIGGQDTNGFLVVASDGKNGLIADLYGPLQDTQSLQDEYKQILSTLSIVDMENVQ